MNQTASVQEVITEKGMREQLKQQLAQHVQEQPESTLSFHRWMKVLEAAGLVLIEWLLRLRDAGWQQAVTWRLLLACPVGMLGMIVDAIDDDLLADSVGADHGKFGRVIDAGLAVS